MKRPPVRERDAAIRLLYGRHKQCECVNGLPECWPCEQFAKALPPGEVVPTESTG